ncbi:hypothetical protein PENANT_c053G02920 [Penicillium antarcticum]|uniref:Uncharacterized protein n=1 Tax=Penicillium antarcticum TaxID=416450 RepID=A0A1V6PS66_9EURO|nr:uncharacterized protein N7508_004015 [Penicillium antarcticum]KAJ5308636.1 hypothetical protein N7508_004015 [Penicillium antarcticum]OQD79346.1 hypothetical protein PENANT_c053G02920 [Penicillium antarcticum]
MPSEEQKTLPPPPNPPNSEPSPTLPLTQRAAAAPPPTPQTPFDQAKLPGCCAFRLENLENQTSQTKKELMNSIAQDICATFTCIAKHAEAGNLEDQHTDVIDNVIKMIRGTDVRTRHRLEMRERRLRRERNWLRMKHLKMSRDVNDLSGLYRKKMRDFNAALRKRNGEIEQLRAERELLMVKIREDRDLLVAKMCDKTVLADDAVGTDIDVDGEFEVDTEV